MTQRRSQVDVVYGDKTLALDDYPWDHRRFVLQGAPFSTGERVFHLLVEEGLREDSALLDFGCGSLRVGRFLIQYLDPGGYYAIEPNKWLVQAAFDQELGHDVIGLKRPAFSHNSDFDAGVFDRLFDFVLLSGVLTHMDHAQMAKTLSSVIGVLRPGGKLVGSIIPQGPDHVGVGWLYPQQAAHYESCVRGLLPDGMGYREIARDAAGAAWFVVEADR